MASAAACTLRKSFVDESDEAFEPLTFGELAVGEHFIWFPSPGDNTGHGGFRGTSWVFEKTDDNLAEAAPGIPYGIPHGGAVSIAHQTPSDLPHSAAVIRVC